MDGDLNGDRDDGGPDNTLGPSESLDSDEVRNDDGDIVVDPPDEWIEVDEDETLDERLAAEVPDVLPPATGGPARQADVRADRRNTRRRRLVLQRRRRRREGVVPGDEEADSIIED